MVNQTDTFWVDDPLILFNKNNIKNLWPDETMSQEEKWNSITRIVMLLSILGFILRGSVNFLIIGIITLALIVVMYQMNTTKKMEEGFSSSNDGTNKLLGILKPTTYKSTPTNPLSNLLMTHIQDEPNRPSAPLSYTADSIEDINKNARLMVKEINNDQPDIDKRLFQDLGDNYQFDQSMRAFYSPASTTNPNAQDDFVKFCYGDMPSRKTDMSTNS